MALRSATNIAPRLFRISPPRQLLDDGQRFKDVRRFDRSRHLQIGLDRPFLKPECRPPSVKDLELVCRELVVTEKMLRELAQSVS